MSAIRITIRSDLGNAAGSIIGYSATPVAGQLSATPVAGQLGPGDSVDLFVTSPALVPPLRRELAGGMRYPKLGPDALRMAKAWIDSNTESANQRFTAEQLLALHRHAFQRDEDQDLAFWDEEEIRGVLDAAAVLASVERVREVLDL